MENETKQMKVIMSKTGTINNGATIMYSTPVFDRESPFRTIGLPLNDVKAVWGKVPDKISVTVDNVEV